MRGVGGASSEGRWGGVRLSRPNRLSSSAPAAARNLNFWEAMRFVGVWAENGGCPRICNAMQGTGGLLQPYQHPVCIDDDQTGMAAPLRVSARHASKPIRDTAIPSFDCEVTRNRPVHHLVTYLSLDTSGEKGVSGPERHSNDHGPDTMQCLQQWKSPVPAPHPWMLDAWGLLFSFQGFFLLR